MMQLLSTISIMPDEKVIIKCPNCGAEARIPVLDKLIRFKCPACKTEHTAINGNILIVGKTTDEDDVFSDHSAEHHEQNLPNEFSDAGEYQTKAQSNNDSDSPTNKGRSKAEASGKPGDSRSMKQVGSWKRAGWKIGTVLFGLSTVILLCVLMMRPGKPVSGDFRVYDSLSHEVINGLRSAQSGDYAMIKPLLTEGTSSRFDLFLQNQLTFEDTGSVNSIRSFINSVSPREYGVCRKFAYVNAKMDTCYFYVDFIPSEGSYKMNVSLDWFLD